MEVQEYLIFLYKNTIFYLKNGSMILSPKSTTVKI